MTYTSPSSLYWIAVDRPLQNHRGFLKIQARIAWVELVWISVAEIAEKVDLPFAVRKEFRIEFVCVEADIGPQSKPKRVRPG